jgi:hypothetical protein
MAQHNPYPPITYANAPHKSLDLLAMEQGVSPWPCEDPLLPADLWEEEAPLEAFIECVKVWRQDGSVAV